MKKILLAVVFGTATGAMAQSAAPPAASPAQTQPAAAPAQGAATPSQPAAQSNAAPVIKDPAEYNAYVSAYSQKDPAAQISGLEAFLTQYPNSIMKAQALEILMSAYQQTGNPKVADAAQRLLALSPDNVKALVVLAFNERYAQKWADAKQHAEHALEVLPKWTKPDGVPQADFDKQKSSFVTIMNSVAGFAALQLKDYADAQKYLRAAVEADPNNVDNVYALATALLPPSTPPDPVIGLFFIARAVNLAPATAKDTIKNFGHNRYVRYHGGEDGWNELLAQTATTPLPPAGFTIKPAPTPAEQAHKMVQDTVDSEGKLHPEKMDFATWEFILSSGAQADQDAVWNAIKGVAVAMNGTVIGTTPTEFMIAGSEDDIEAKKADITLKFEDKVPLKMIPKDGASFDFAGEPASYTPNPFMMTMEKGKLVSAKPTTPAHKPAAKKPAAQ
jgi:tetratricopeptide (TPR) repeat protein